MAQDEPQEKDATFTEQGVAFVIDRDLLEEVKPVGVDFVESEGRADFKISSSLPDPGDCGSCGS